MKHRKMQRHYLAALIPLFVALSSIVATTGLLAVSSQFVAADQSIMEVILLIGLAVGVALATLSVVLFVVGLGLPLLVWPEAIGR